MKIKLIFLALLLCLYQSVNAQTTEEASYKNHFGLIASPKLNKVFTSNSELPVGLVYKRQFKGNGMFRGTLIGSGTENSNNNDIYQYSFSPSTDMQIFTNRYETAGTSFYVQLTGGYEWHVPLSNRWAFYYGAEAGPVLGRSISKFHTEHAQSSGENNGENNYRNDTHGAIIRPFSGFVFQISDRVYIATETAIIAHSYRYKSTVTTSNVEPQITTHVFGNQLYNGTARGISYKPISNISLLLRF